MTSPQTAERAAEAMVNGFIFHDRGDYEQSIEAFTIADKIHFGVDEETARGAAEGYVNALKAKDELEDYVDTMSDLDSVSWFSVFKPLRKRANALGINTQYAHLTTEAWKQHKIGGDYWTPVLEAQQYVVQAAIDDPEYPHKQSDGRNGYGPEPALYLVSVECHDLHTESRVELGKRIMTEYYKQIIRMREA